MKTNSTKGRSGNFNLLLSQLQMKETALFPAKSQRKELNAFVIDLEGLHIEAGPKDSGPNGFLEEKF